MDEGWKYYEGKKVFLILKSGRQYSGKIIRIDNSKPPAIWISMIDKFNQKVLFCHSEVDVIEEEKEDGQKRET